MANELDDVFRGDTYEIDVEVTEPSTGLAVDISGWDFYVTFKRHIDDPDSQAELQVQQTASSGSSDGKITLTLSSSDTDIDTGLYEMDIQRVIDGTPPDVLTVHKQRISVRDDVTQNV